MAAGPAHRRPTVFNLTIASGKTFTIQAQGSNDLQNWDDLTAVANEKISIGSSDTPGYYTATTTFIDDVPYANVRLSYSTDSTTSTDYIIVNAGIGVFHE